MGDETRRVEQATNTQRIVSLESRMRQVEANEKDHISKKAITWLLVTLAAAVTLITGTIKLMGG